MYKKPLDHKIMKKHRNGRTKYISFGSLKDKHWTSSSEMVVQIHPKDLLKFNIA
jgi:hypothetical protein